MLGFSRIKSKLKVFIGSTLRRNAHKILPNEIGTINKVAAKVSEDCADFVLSHSEKAMILDNRFMLLKYACLLAPDTGLHAEFGVFKGESINFLARTFPHRKFYGFDSFEGLKEDWLGTRFVKGYFDVGGKLPAAPKNVEFRKGWFDTTLPVFLSDHGDDFAFVHIDCDTYEATRTVFDAIETKIKSGTVICFDEHHGYLNWRNGEYKALQELLSRTNLAAEYVAFTDYQAAVIIRDSA
jgi:hypothetical protein